MGSPYEHIIGEDMQGILGTPLLSIGFWGILRHTHIRVIKA